MENVDLSAVHGAVLQLLTDVDEHDVTSLRRWLRGQNTADITSCDLDVYAVQQELFACLLNCSVLSADKNLLLRLIRVDHSGRSHAQLALKLILAMSKRSKTWGCFIRRTLNTDCLTAADRGNGVLHEAALTGRCGALADFVDNGNVNLTNRYGETPLHLAAMAGTAEDVRLLLEAGADVLRRDVDGCTPIHAAAQSADPSCAVSRQLLDALRKRGRQSDNIIQGSLVNSAGNTPLHIAAGNVNVSGEFIGILFNFQQHRIPNSERDTPFHIAAKSDNPAIIVELLRSLKSSPQGCNIDELDTHRSQDDLTLIELAAVAGNAKAVSLMIQNGADICQRLLHTIITESVRDPSKTDRLIGVYQAVVDNALRWRSVHEHEKFPVGDRLYFQRRMETVMYLLTRRDENASEMNVVEHAIAVGARKMLETIVNTENVFRFSDNPFERTPQAPSGDLQYRGVWYIITNFVSSTESPLPNSKDVEKPEAETATENVRHNFNKVFKPTRPYLSSMVLKSSAKWCKTNTLLTEPFRKLTMPFIKFVQLIYFLLALIQFFYMTMFAMFRLPTACSLSERFNVVLPSCTDARGEDQELQMEEFPGFWWLIWPCLLFLNSAGYLTVTCARSVVDRLSGIRRKVVGHSAISCDLDDSSHTCITTTPSSPKASEGQAVFCSSPVSPTPSSPSTSSEGEDVVDGNFVTRPISVRFVSNNTSTTDTTDKSGTTSSTNTAAPSDQRTADHRHDVCVGVHIVNFFPIVAFCVSVFLWYAQSWHSVTMNTYIQTTSMIFLFGWTTSFVFFSRIKKEFYLFSLVLQEFITKDVCYKFIPLFFFTVVAFSFSFFVLQLPSSHTSIDGVVYDLVMTAGSINPFERATNAEQMDGRSWLMKIVFTIYVYFTAVILLNVLIAMMNHRYDDAKVRAEREWRFQSVQIAMTIQNNGLYQRIMRRLLRSKLSICRFLRCDKHYDEDSQQFLVAIVQTNDETSDVSRTHCQCRLVTSVAADISA